MIAVIYPWCIMAGLDEGAGLQHHRQAPWSSKPPEDYVAVADRRRAAGPPSTAHLLHRWRRVGVLPVPVHSQDSLASLPYLARHARIACGTSGSPLRIGAATAHTLSAA